MNSDTILRETPILIWFILCDYNMNRVWYNSSSLARCEYLRVQSQILTGFDEIVIDTRKHNCGSTSISRDWWHERYLDFVCMVVGPFVCEINGVFYIMRNLMYIMLL